MKNGKRPTKQQKQIISSHGFNPNHWLVVKNANSTLTLVHRDMKQTKEIPSA